MALSHSPSIVTDGLILCLDAANPKSYPGSGTTWSDLSGQANNGTLTNGPTYDSDNLGSFVFDGVNDSVNITSSTSVAGLTNYSASIWVNLDSSSSGVDTRFFWRGNYGVLFYKGSDDIIYYFLRNVSNSTDNFGTTVSSLIANWKNITITYDGSVKRLYVDGNFLSSQNFTGGIINDNPTMIRLGGYSSAGFYTPCKISYCLEYNRTLTLEEVQQNFNATRSRYNI
jgi:hypothetical protein